MAEEYEDGSIEWHESGNIYGDAETVYEFYLYESNVLKEHVTHNSAARKRFADFDVNAEK